MDRTSDKIIYLIDNIYYEDSEGLLTNISDKNGFKKAYFGTVSNIICTLFLVLLILLFIMSSYGLKITNNYKDGKESVVISCYYNFPSGGAAELVPQQVQAHLCTHINVAFAQVKEHRVYVTDAQRQTIQQLIQLKKNNKNLKVLLSIGGAGNNNGFSDMVVNHTTRKEFIRSIKYTLRNNSLDGVDLDWEFPALHYYDTDLRKRERQHFSQLLREIRMEYIREKRNYLLTVALAAPQIIVDVAYDVDQINMYVDYANIMSYDFHVYTQFTPFTGLNSPLYARAVEHFYMATLNVNYTVNMYLSKGLSQSKLVVGIPTYGHSFTLINKNNSDIGSPASGYGQLGGLGFVNYPEVCKFIKNNPNISIVEENTVKVPYLHMGPEWVSYETPKSVSEKAEYIKAYQLRGAMIYSLNADDYSGQCADRSLSHSHFPLVTSVKTIFDSTK